MAKNSSQTVFGAITPWETTSEETVRLLASALELVPIDHGLRDEVATLFAAQRTELCQKRDAYFASLMMREPDALRIERLSEFDRFARGAGLSPAVCTAIVHDRLLALGQVLRARARSKADCASHWSALSALEVQVRADLSNSEEQMRDHKLEEFAQEVGENAQGTSSTLFVLTQTTEPLEAAAAVLEAVRAAFTWEFATYYTVSTTGDLLTLSFTSGELPERLVRAHHEAHPRSGEGHLGRAFARGDVAVLSIDQEPSGSLLRQELERAGVKTLIALPITVSQRVVGVMGFAVRRVLEVSEPRRDALRQVAIQVSSTLERMQQVTEMRDVAGAAEAVNRVLRRINLAATGADAVTGTLEAVREAFDWEYGAVWTRARHGSELMLDAESGDVGPEFRRATKLARYGRGVGVVGRVFQARDLVVVDDLGALHDDVRAGAARDAGIRSGVCFPLIARDEVIGAIEVWSTRSVKLSTLRLDALRSVSSAVSSTLERLEERDAFATSLRDFAGELMEVSRALRSTTAEQSASAQELASAIGEVTATLSELRETSSEALRNAELVIAKAEGAFQTSASGRESVVHAIASMRAIREQVSEIAERILQLNDQTSQIGNIISTVNEISAQSKLLALNAAIEAARAGEHGKGFGVVASEIRSLAEQSKEATNQVREILGEIQGSTNAAVVAAEEGTKKSESGMALADVSGEKIQELARSMEESSSSARLIANSARQQSAGIEQAAQALVSISNATNSTAAGLKQTEFATTQLVALAERMATIVRAMAESGNLLGSAADNQNAAE